MWAGESDVLAGAEISKESAVATLERVVAERRSVRFSWSPKWLDEPPKWLDEPPFGLIVQTQRDDLSE